MDVLFGADFKESEVIPVKKETLLDKCILNLKRFDENYLKPLMIHNYKKRLTELNEQRKLKVT